MVFIVSLYGKPGFAQRTPEHFVRQSDSRDQARFSASRNASASFTSPRNSWSCGLRSSRFVIIPMFTVTIGSNRTNLIFGRRNFSRVDPPTHSPAPEVTNGKREYQSAEALILGENPAF